MFLVTGTDTGVGKTFVTASLIRYLRQKGIGAVGFKAVETGCSEECKDAQILSVVSGIELKPVYSLKNPLAPAVAAEIEKIKIEPRKIENRIAELSKISEVLLVEGAGGLLVPITWKYTFLDLAKRLNMEVIVVALNKLGVINHTLLTVESCKYGNVKVRCVILNTPKEFDRSSETNLRTLQKLLNIPVIPFSCEKDSPLIVSALC